MTPLRNPKPKLYEPVREPPPSDDTEAARAIEQWDLEEESETGLDDEDTIPF